MHRVLVETHVLLADLLRRVLHRRAPDQRVLEVWHCPVADASERVTQITHVHLRNKMDQPPRAAMSIARRPMNGAMGQGWAGG